MKVAISATQADLNAKMDPRFGRAQYFVIYDTDTGQYETIENPNIMAAGGAGIQSAQMIISSGANAVISGSFGPNASMTLQSAGVSMYVGNPAAPVKENIDMLINGELSPAPSGMGPTPGPGRFGRGGGFGPGGGRGPGRNW